MSATTTAKKRAPRKAAAPRLTERQRELAEIAAQTAEDTGNVELTPEEIAELTREYKIVNDDGSVNPVEIGKSGRRPNQLVHIFTLDGEKHYVPEKPSAAAMVKFLKDARTKGIGRRAATENLLVDVLGEENLAALASSPEVDDDDCARVFGIVAHLCFGRLKEMTERAGEASRGSKK